MTKKKTTKLGAIGGSGDEHLETREPRITEYERLRLESIKENMSKMQELGLKEKAMSLMARVQNSRGNCSKHKMNMVSAEDGLYGPNQDSNMELELDSFDEELLIPHSKSNLKSRTIPCKSRKMKVLTRKAVTASLAFQKHRLEVDLASSHGGSSTLNHTLQQPIETLGSKVEHLSQNENDKENGEKDKPRRGPTMCYNVHGRSDELWDYALFVVFPGSNKCGKLLEVPTGAPYTCKYCLHEGCRRSGSMNFTAFTEECKKLFRLLTVEIFEKVTVVLPGDTRFGTIAWDLSANHFLIHELPYQGTRCQLGCSSQSAGNSAALHHCFSLLFLFFFLFSLLLVSF